MLGPMTGFDIGLVVTRMDDYVQACRKAIAARWPGAYADYFGHVGDGNIHINVHVPGADPQPKAEVEALVYGMVRDFGGTISAEHGIGTRKQKYLPYTRSPVELALMATIKKAIDPKNILNPGKIITLPD